MLARLLITAVLLGVTGRVFAWEMPKVGDILESSRSGLVKIIVTGIPANGVPVVDYGSGFVITPAGYIVSAAHLFPDTLKDLTISGRLAYLRNDDERQRDNLIDISLLWKDVGRDVALLKFSQNPDGMRALPIALRVPNPTDTLYVLGFPGGQNLNTSYPAVYQGALTTDRFQYQGIANRGNSGGPILDRDGYVVGLVSETQDVINSAPISNTYRGVPAKNFPIPKEFNPSSIRPHYLPREGFVESAVTDGIPARPIEQPDSALDEYRSGEKARYCKISIPKSWNFRRSSELGFLIAPPTGSALLDAQFQFEFIVRGKESYLTRQEQLENSGRFWPTPYKFTALNDQSIVLLRTNMGDEGSPKNEAIPFAFLAKDHKYLLFRYLPRYFNKYQFRPEGADSAFLMCTATTRVPRKLFFSLCESLLGQALDGYYDSDNPCLPGSSAQ